MTKIKGLNNYLKKYCEWLYDLDIKNLSSMFGFVMRSLLLQVKIIPIETILRTHNKTLHWILLRCASQKPVS